MAYYGKDYIDDDRVSIDLYIDDFRQDLIVEDYRSQWRIIKDSGRLRVYDGKDEITDWKRYNLIIWDACVTVGIYRDVIADMLMAYGLTMSEISVVCVTNKNTMRSNVKYWLRLSSERMSELQRANSRYIFEKDSITFDSNAERIMAELFDDVGLVYRREALNYTYVDSDGKKRHSRTIPDFLLDNGIVLYIDGYTHDIPKTVERDARQVEGLTLLGCRVVRIREHLLISETYSLLVDMLVNLVSDSAYDYASDLSKIESVYDIECRRLSGVLGSDFAESNLIS